jgi:cell division protein FtsL
MQDNVAPAHRRWVNRAIAREVDHDRARWLWGVFVAMLLAAAPFAAYLLEQNECLRLSYEVSALRQQHDELAEQDRRLRMQRARLESLEKIESWAVQRRGLVHPSPEQVIVVRRTSTTQEEVRAAESGSN